MKRLGFIGLGVLFIAIASTYIFIDPSESAFFPKCPFLMLTGLYCPGCGSQRAIHAMLHGDILAGLNYNLMIALAILVILYQGYVQLANRMMQEPVKNLLHRSSFTNGILIVVLLFWIVRNIPEYPFKLLAP